MAVKRRAKWWIVSTHVLTTGLVMPLLAGIVGATFVGGSGLQGLTAFVLVLVNCNHRI